MTEQDRTDHCRQCGSPLESGDEFCGSCGAVVLPPAPQTDQVIPEPPPTTQNVLYAPRRRKRFWVNAAAISLLLLVSVGAVAALALNSGLNPLGGSDPQPAGDRGNESASKEDTVGPKPASISPDAPPDPAFDRILPTLRSRTTSLTMLPAKLPDVLKNVAIQSSVPNGNRYGILFFGDPQDDVVEDFGGASVVATLAVVPNSEAEANQYNQATSVETVKLPDGTEAKLRRMEPVRQVRSKAPYWEGGYVKNGQSFTLTTTNGMVTKEDVEQALSTMVQVKWSEDEPTAPSTQPNPDEEALEEFGHEYDEANRSGDWGTTYSMLDEESQQQFTEEEWAKKQQALRDAEGPLAPLQSVSVDLPEGVSDTSGNVILYYQDGTSDTIVAGIPMAVTSEEEAGEPKRTLTEEEISYLEQVPTDDGGAETTESEPTASSDDLSAEAEEAAGNYYRASGVEDWDYTYDNLDSETQSGFTREEWSQKNQWFADQGETIYNIESVDMNGISEKPSAEVAVRLTGEDGSSSIRTTYFVLENGEWKHRFGQEEIDLFGPGVPFDEWVDVQ